jgi:hypothetical protein
MEVFDSPSHYYPSDAMSLDELAYWIAFNRVSGIGPVSFKSLLDYFQDDLAAAWQADSKELAQAGLTQRAIENLKTPPVEARGVLGDTSTLLFSPCWRGKVALVWLRSDFGADALRHGGYPCFGA